MPLPFANAETNIPDEYGRAVFSRLAKTKKQNRIKAYFSGIK